jgi:tol-pal system protein YbgF
MAGLLFRAIICAVVALVVAACASGSKSAAPSSGPAERSSAERPPRPPTLEDVRKTQETQTQEVGRLTGEVKALDAQQAFLVAELKSLTEQLAKLKASVDDARLAVEAIQRATPVTPPPTPPPAALSQPPPPMLPPAAPPRAAAAPPTAPLRNPDADRMFAAALAKLRAGEDGQAALEFTEFVTQFPNHPQAAAAQNWIGEAFYRQRDYKQAATEFQKTVDNYTQTTQVAEALLKIGLCKRAMGDVAGARAAWEQVIKQYPRSEAATQARGLLAARTNGGSRVR